MFEGREAARWKSWKVVGAQRLGWHCQGMEVTSAQDKLPSQVQSA